MNKALGLLSIGLLFIVSCGTKSSRFPEFSVTPTGVHYKLIALGDGTTRATPTDYITVQISYRTESDSLFFSGVRKFQLTEPHFEGSIDECFAMLAQGDSAAFYIDATSFFSKTLETSIPTFINANAYLRVDIRMLEVQTEKQYQQEKEAFLTWIEDFGEYEKVILRQYLQDEHIEIAPATGSGLYYISLSKGTGEGVLPGDTVTVHYEGRFLNGKYFDSTKKRSEAFQFVYGQKWQVIDGLEEAIGLMSEGERALFILPSNIAFGQGGSSTGIVPPFTSVIFEVELVEVKSSKK